MDRYVVQYTDKSGGLSSLWVYASSKEEAEIQARKECWDIVDIFMVLQM